MMMIMSAPSSSFHDYLATDNFLLKTESLSPIKTNDEHVEEFFDNNNNNRINRISTIKRPMNAFLLWARGERKRLSSDGYGVSQTSLSKLLGETWRHMPVDEKQPFLDMAESLKRQHQIDHPAYRFKPKQRSAIANKTIVKKHHSPIPFSYLPHLAQRQLSTMISSSLFSQQQQQEASSFMSNVTPHQIQPTVLAMCQAIIPTTLSDNNNDWFLKLIGQPQPVIVAPHPRAQTSPISSRRAVRIQIINKHDDIILPPPSLLPMTPSPLSSSSIPIDESTPTLVDYLTNSGTLFHLPINHQESTPILDDIIGYEQLQDSSNVTLMDLDQTYDVNGWIDTPLSNFGTNSTDIISIMPYDFLCL